MRKSILGFLLLTSCGAIGAAAEYGHDRVQDGDMSNEEYGSFMYHTVGADRQAADRAAGGFGLLDLLGSLGVIGGGAGGGALLVRLLRGSALKSGSGEEKVS